MPTGLEILLAASGWVAWFAKEALTKLMDRRLARSGRIGVIEGRSRIVCDTESKHAGAFVVDYFTDMPNYPQYADCTRFRIEIDAQLFNDSDTQVVFTKFEFEFWGVDGLRMQYRGARVLTAALGADIWQPAAAITVPAHSTTRARFEMPIGSTFSSVEESVRETYGEAVALLRTQSIDGKQTSFRLTTRSFAGARMVVWPPDRKYPIFNIYSLNREGRNAGRRPQPRSGTLT